MTNLFWSVVSKDISIIMKTWSCSYFGCMNFVAEQNSSRVYSFREAEEEIKTDVGKLSASSSHFRLLNSYLYFVGY